MDWKDLGAKIAASAPGVGGLIGTFAGGPVGAVAGTSAGKAIQYLASLFGIKEADPTPEMLDAAITADPQAFLKLRLAEMTHQEEMAKIENDRLRAENEEMQSARSRQIEHEKATGKSDVSMYVLAWIIVGGFLGLTASLILCAYYGKPVVDQTGVLYMLLGTLSTAFGMVVGYFFGSSKGSADKSLVMENTARTLATATSDTAKVLATKK